MQKDGPHQVVQAQQSSSLQMSSDINRDIDAEKRDLQDMLGDITPLSATHKDVSDLPDHSM